MRIAIYQTTNMSTKPSQLLITITLLIYAACTPQQPTQVPTREHLDSFNGQRAFRDAAYQVSLGPRTPGSAAHTATAEWIAASLTEAGWTVENQETNEAGKPVRNIIARWGEGRPWVLLGAHYDTRFYADRDAQESRRQEAVPGANDGASGVAVLLELARTIPAVPEAELNPGQIWLVFFDAEDNGNIMGWEWLLGSQAFVRQLGAQKPDAVVIADMVGDADLELYLEKNSHPELAADIWQIAADLGYAHLFIPEEKHRLLDDHVPFQRVGIPAVDIIDFDYPYWHTTGDTLDKISPYSLEVVGETLLAWLMSEAGSQ